ncbi:hypothetical protein [Synechococcus sp. PCC 6312]|uniref:hypothetical protein n=1 Tax=Synechococcus sp. (strain ATCC 27167 / PCC 6312) TaxID=195253 RepID=UPI00029F075C|nr:hypothetical protein [Synechococcus sp. PCC 6312]AFY60357.1 hypothetical protein Syn6312_1172 [Synechococcus sp. PCC 6312]
MADYPFVEQPQYTAIALAYTNQAMIADIISPRIPVTEESFKWQKHKLEDGMTIVDTRVGRTSRPNQVEFATTEETSSCEDYGLDDPIPQKDIENAPKGYDPQSYSTEMLTELIQIDREKRVADLVFNLNTYPSAQRQTLAGSSQFSHPDSKPIDVMLNALDEMVMRANTAVFGQNTWTKFRRNPAVVSAINGKNSSESVTRQQVAEFLEVDRVIVGASWLNSAKRGQSASMTRLWGKHIALLYLKPLAAYTRGITFTFTAQHGQRVAGTIQDPHIGLKGGVIQRVGESVKEVIAAPDCGYFFQDAVA